MDSATHTVREFLFTSESVCPGHPDKLCDQVSDRILDACLKQDPESKCAVECAVKDSFVFLLGEITTRAVVDYEQIARDTIKDIGFDSVEKGIDYRTCTVHVHIGQQSPDIAQGVHLDRDALDIGAGDQGLMFGYATDETPERHPIAHLLANRLAERLVEVRKAGTLPYLRPDAKTQVTVKYSLLSDGSLLPVGIHNVVLSTQHDDDIELERLRKDIKLHVIDPILPAELVTDELLLHINPSERFVIGGPAGDAGLTGRKIIVDAYGGAGSHGGGCFSGKDATKVDRSGSYAARWVARSLVDAGVCRRCLVQVAYMISDPDITSLYVDTYGSGRIPDCEIEALVRANFDLRPGAIIASLDLKRPRFAETAVFGHFGRVGAAFDWEVPRSLKGWNEQSVDE